MPTLTKKKYVELVPQFKDLKKQRDQKVKDLEKAEAELCKLDDIVEQLEGVELFEDFPLLVDDEDHEIFPALPIERHAFLESDSYEPKIKDWAAYARKGGDEPVALVEGVTKAEALKAAKTFVATGKIPKEPAAARPPKAAKPAKVVEAA